jgi:hypothetical protein
MPSRRLVNRAGCLEQSHSVGGSWLAHQTPLYSPPPPFSPGALLQKADTPVARKARENKLEVELAKKDDDLREAGARIEQLSSELVNTKADCVALEADNTKLVELYAAPCSSRSTDIPNSKWHWTRDDIRSICSLIAAGKSDTQHPPHMCSSW